MSRLRSTCSWSLLGFLIVGAVTLVLIVSYQIVFEPVTGSDLRAWQNLAAASGALGGGLVGLLVGGFIGMSRHAKDN